MRARTQASKPPMMRHPRTVSSRPGEFHPQALPKPCMTLSSHTAPDVQPLP